jgi:hypothetical protein
VSTKITGQLSPQDLLGTFSQVGVTAREAANIGLPGCSLLGRPLLIVNEPQLHTVAGMQVHATALQLVSQRTVDDQLLGAGICGGTHINIEGRPGVLSREVAGSGAGDHFC